MVTKSLFLDEEWKEITTSVAKDKPKLENSLVNLLKKYTVVMLRDYVMFFLNHLYQMDANMIENIILILILLMVLIEEFYVCGKWKKTLLLTLY